MSGSRILGSEPITQQIYNQTNYAESIHITKIYFPCLSRVFLIIIQSLLVFLRHISIPISFINCLSFRSSRPEVLREEGRPATLLKKRLWHSCFPVNFTKFLRTPFLQNTSDGCFYSFLFFFK